MAVRRISMKDMTGFDLTPQELGFVLEYCKDYKHRRAAQMTGYDPDYGAKLLKKPAIELAIQTHSAKKMEFHEIDPKWVLMELVDNHQIARYEGKLSASNTALLGIAKHQYVDAFAADKVMNITDQAVVERLLRGRKRTGNKDGMPVIPHTPTPKDPPVSFL